MNEEELEGFNWNMSEEELDTFYKTLNDDDRIKFHKIIFAQMLKDKEERGLSDEYVENRRIKLEKFIEAVENWKMVKEIQRRLQREIDLIDQRLDYRFMEMSGDQSLNLYGDIKNKKSN